MEHLRTRNVVLGAGAMGLATAYHLARRGEPVWLVEQFALGHDRGSSHGAGRITRHSYADVRYARLMPAAFDAWRQLEVDAGQTFYVRTGGVSFGPPEVDYVAQVAASLQAIDIPHRRMTGAELNRAWSAFRVPDDFDVVFEPDAGMLAAARILRAELELARVLGGEATRILENCRVRRIDLDSERPTLLTDNETIVADRLVVTAGPWTHRLFPHWPLPLRSTRQQVLYFRPNLPSEFAPGQFPVFIYKGKEEIDMFYGMPGFEGLGVKVARHDGPESDPDLLDPDVGDEYREEVRAFLGGCIPSLADAPIERTEVCYYTVAPNDHFQLGSPRGRPDIIVASPCSGHGFKFSCLLGRTLAELASTGESELSIDLWKPSAE
ncbi:MAG: N-methyl-L-tryptophan oxidase [Isosphaeraceae bacterium]